MDAKTILFAKQEILLLNFKFPHQSSADLLPI